MMPKQKQLMLKERKSDDHEEKKVIPKVYHRERIWKSSTLSCNEEKEEITKPPTR